MTEKQLCVSCNERPVKYTGKQLCARCYKREWFAANYVPVAHVAAADRRDPIAYASAHTRVRNVFGKAKTHTCVDCGNPAQEWSYNGGSEWEQTGEYHYWDGRVSVMKWSPDPNSYSPRCRKCHLKYDGKV